MTRRDGSRRGLIFDGKQLTVFDVDENVHATVAKPGTVDAALEYYTEELGMRLPLRELFAADLMRDLKDRIAGARLVGRETIAGADTDHVAFRGESGDVQLWIARNGDPLPQRIVISKILVPRRDPQHPLPNQSSHRVLGAVLRPAIDEAGGESIQQADRSLGSHQQQRSGIRAHFTAIECRDHSAAFYA